MSATAGAAEAVVRTHMTGVSAARAESGQGRFRGRTATELPAVLQGLSIRESREARRNAGATAERISPGTRLVNVLRNALRLSVSHRQAPTRDVADVEMAAGEGEMPRGVDSAPGPASFRNAAATHAREPASSTTPLPWLTPHQNAHRQTLYRRLEECVARQDAPASSMADLAAVLRIVDRVEQEIQRARELLQKSQAQLLSDDEWSELSILILSHRNPSPSYRVEYVDRLARLAENGIPGSTTEMLSHELQLRFALAQTYLSSSDLPWDSTVRQFEERSPVAPHTPIVAQCRVVPGTALGAHFQKGYPGEDRENLYCAERYSHVPALALTTTGRAGRTLISALRHGLIHAGELDGEFLAGLPDAELKTMVGALLFGEACDVNPGRNVARSIDELSQRIKASPRDAALQATAMRSVACRHMARETAAAALVADPVKFQRALAGETVNLPIFSIALVEPGEIDAWCYQAEAFAELSEGGPVELHLRNPQGASCTVLADVQVRQFVLSPALENSRFNGLIYCHSVLLFGPAEDQAVEGEIGARVDAMTAQASQIHLESQEIQRLYTRRDARPGAQGFEATVRRLVQLEGTRASLEQNARSLEQAAQQLKSMWAEDGRRGWPRCDDVYERVAARLALVCHLMGETPALSCNTGYGLVDRVQPDLTSVASVADHLGGHVPPVDPAREQRQQVLNRSTNQ